MGGPNADKNLLVFHGDVLHGEDGLCPKTANKEVHLILCDKPLHGIGRIRNVKEFIGIRLDKLNFHFFCANLNTPLAFSSSAAMVAPFQ